MGKKPAVEVLIYDIHFNSIDIQEKCKYQLYLQRYEDKLDSVYILIQKIVIDIGIDIL